MMNTYRPREYIAGVSFFVYLNYIYTKMGKVEGFYDTNSPSKLIYTTHKTGRYFTYNKTEATGHLSIKHGKDIDHHQQKYPQVMTQPWPFHPLFGGHKNRLRFPVTRTHHPQKTPQSHNCQVQTIYSLKTRKIWPDTATHNNQKQPNKLISLMLLGYIRIHIFSGHHQTNNPTTAAPFCRRHPARSIRASWQCQ